MARLNSTRVYTDEARYRCYLYQKQGGASPSSHGGSSVVFKMSQSDKASCVGLWSVEEGVKTFTLKKREFVQLKKTSQRCTFLTLDTPPKKNHQNRCFYLLELLLCVYKSDLSSLSPVLTISLNTSSPCSPLSLTLSVYSPPQGGGGRTICQQGKEEEGGEGGGSQVV